MNTKTKPPEAYSQSVAALRVLVDGDHIVKTIPAKDPSAPPLKIYEQRAIVIGGPQRLFIGIGCREASEILQEGMYFLGSSLFQTGRFGNLEVNRFAENAFVFSGKPLTDDQKQLFSAEKTDLSDYS